MNAQQEIQHLNNQHPKTWTAGAWYPATTLQGRKCQIKRTTAVKTGCPYLHIRYAGTLNTKTPAGEIIDSRAAWFNFRANLRTFEIKEL